MHLEENVPVRTGKFRVLAVILIGVFIFAVGGVGGYWVGSRQQQSLSTALQASPKPSWLPSASPFQRLSPTPTIAASQTNPTAGWKLYLNTKVGFSIKYPPNWSYSDNVNDTVPPGTLADTTIYFYDATNKQANYEGITLRVEENNKGLSLEEWPDELYKEATGGIGSSETLTKEQTSIATGYQALKVFGIPSRNTEYLILVLHDRKMLIAGLDLDLQSLRTNKARTYEYIFHMMINTIHFL